MLQVFLYGNALRTQAELSRTLSVDRCVQRKQKILFKIDKNAKTCTLPLWATRREDEEYMNGSKATLDGASRDLMRAGYREVWVTAAALEAMGGANHKEEAVRISDRYLHVWPDQGRGLIAVPNVGGKTVCAGRRKRGRARIDIWVQGEIEKDPRFVVALRPSDFTR